MEKGVKRKGDRKKRKTEINRRNRNGGNRKKIKTKI